MGRYDQPKGKKSGRYQSAESKKSEGISIPVVIILMTTAGIGGFYFAKQVENYEVMPELKALINTQPINKKESPEGLLKPVQPKTSADNIEELPPEDYFVLPELASSDKPVREAMFDVSPELAPWFSSDQLIRKYMVIANDFSQGLRIDKHLRFLKSDQPFVADVTETGLFMAASNPQRYNKLASAIDAINVKAALSVYKKLKPLLLQVFAEFSYPEDYTLESIFTKAAEEILAAPIIDGTIPLVKHSSRYKYADPKLEALPPLHKQMIRMGAENTRIIQNKLRELVEELKKQQNQ